MESTVIKFNTVITTLTTFIMLIGTAYSSLNMDKYVESSLIEVCKSVKKNDVLMFNKTTKFYRLKNKTVANNVMCNGEDIIDFAEKHGAYKIAVKLKSSIGNMQITDIAANSKLNVTFEG